LAANGQYHGNLSICMNSQAASHIMRSWILRFLALLGVAGCGIWIGKSPREVEPYVTLVGATAGVLAMFRDRPKANVTLSFRPQGAHMEAFVFENIGDADATNLDMKFFLREGQAAPVYQHDTGLPLAILYPHHRHLVRVFCTITSGVQFDVEWSWTTRGVRRTEVRRMLATLEQHATA
jgi:hypothetical protein